MNYTPTRYDGLFEYIVRPQKAAPTMSWEEAALREQIMRYGEQTAIDRT
jgi:hypothetical protein